ncbi:hypothetical protein SAMN06265222_101586 [Neorhodopirellula lusitana]|uniref:Uncharacterized protein n=1 Tax=Neorhodopirellula lusitana TaxID=445327 RepID=A0ABY1PPL6_9BACT|nr:hypothetical protein SAMN06265222_101586 [Neorhodopirellula lusitana]
MTTSPTPLDETNRHAGVDFAIVIPTHLIDASMMQALGLLNAQDAQATDRWEAADAPTSEMTISFSVPALLLRIAPGFKLFDISQARKSSSQNSPAMGR